MGTFGKGRTRGAAACHPDRPHFSRGYCVACYWQHRRAARRATCHPDQPYEALGLCHTCYQRHRYEAKQAAKAARAASASAVQALFNAVHVRMTDSDPVPQRVDGPVQHVFETLPDVCPKCHSPILSQIPRGVECQFGCGWTGYLVRPGTATVRLDRDHSGHSAPRLTTGRIA